MSLHIEAPEGAIAPKVLLPGDPLRAKYIAETYLEDAECYNSVSMEIRSVIFLAAIDASFALDVAYAARCAVCCVFFACCAVCADFCARCAVSLAVFAFFAAVSCVLIGIGSRSFVLTDCTSRRSLACRTTRVLPYCTASDSPDAKEERCCSVPLSCSCLVRKLRCICLCT